MKRSGILFVSSPKKNAVERSAGIFLSACFLLYFGLILFFYRNWTYVVREQLFSTSWFGSILVLYLALFLVSGAAISVIENLPMGACLFETASALGTVGLSLGITPGLGAASRCILMALMFLGRVGGLTFVYAFLSSNGKTNSKLPLENIMVG